MILIIMPARSLALSVGRPAGRRAARQVAAGPKLVLPVCRRLLLLFVLQALAGFCSFSSRRRRRACQACGGRQVRKERARKKCLAAGQSRATRGANERAGHKLANETWRPPPTSCSFACSVSLSKGRSASAPKTTTTTTYPSFRPILSLAIQNCFHSAQ